jgi:3-methyladenine DNA glycosylase AlkD
VYQEELILHALVLAHAPISVVDKVELIKGFVPYINSWAVCDIFCADLKQTKSNLALFYKTFQNYTNSNYEYQIRFFYVLALNYFINEEMINDILNLISKQKYVGYYDKMAVAWFLSMAYIKFPQKIQKFISKTPLEKFVFSKTISKICDSHQVKKEAKLQLRNLASQVKN